MLYYVKSDILFQNIDVTVTAEDGTEYKFFFDCGALQNKQNTVDFFINKDARRFLTEQLDLYLHQILLD